MIIISQFQSKDKDMNGGFMIVSVQNSKYYYVKDKTRNSTSKTTLDYYISKFKLTLIK